MLQKNQSGSSLLVVFLVIVLIGTVAGTGWYVLTKNKENTTQKQSVATENQAVTPGSLDKTVQSGLGAFEVVFPAGTGEVLKDTQGDVFIIPGKDQPSFQSDKPVTITDVEGYGSDSPSVFSIMVYDNFEPPRGTATDFSIGKAGDELKGKKYVYEYQADELIGIGIQRIKGDRDYEYVFDLANGKKLRVWYAVFASDPRNNIDTIDEIVRSIHLLK